MKKLSFLILFLAVHLVHAQAPDPDFNDKMAFGEGKVHQKSAVFAEADDYASFDLVYQRLSFSINPAVNFIAGSVLSVVKFQQDNAGLIRFDLADAMIVDSIHYNIKKVGFQHSGNKISITLPLPGMKNVTGEVEVFYHGSPPDTGLGSFVQNEHNEAPIIWTLSEPYGAKDWWPCKESLADKIDSLDVFITCPAQYKAACNGKLVSDQVEGDKRTAHWKHRYPIATYLVGVAVTNYETYSDTLDLPDGQKMEILNYVYPEYLTIAKLKSEKIPEIMDFYNTKFITYPFAKEKYGHAQFGWGGGMEHQTMSFMTNLDFELVAHEMAHQWFGDYITLSSWHDIWLNEGFATYLTGMVFENLQGGVWWPAWKNSQVKRITSLPEGSVYVADTTDIKRIFNGRLSYSKGAYLLHMLRWEMGDELFFNGMKNYLNDPAVANGFASHNKFVEHMETVADTSFTEFFKDWYYGEGYPVYQLNIYTDFGDNGQQKLRIRQTPSHSSVSFFRMHVPVRLWKGGKYTDLRLYNTKQEQDFMISAEKVDSVQFDPDNWLCAVADRVLPVFHISETEKIRIIHEVALSRVRVVMPDYSGKETFRIIDLNGRTMSSGLLPAEDSGIDLQMLKRGLYVVEVATNRYRKTEKIVISK